MVALLLMSCGSDPWSGAPPLPPEPTERALYSLSILGSVAGFEERMAGAGVMTRRRTWSLWLGGDEATLRSSTRIEHQAGLVSAYVRWDPQGEMAWTGAAWVPDALAPPEGGLLPVLDPWTLEVAPLEVRRDGDVVAWEASGGLARARFDDRGLVWAEQGAVRMERVDGVPELVAFDPVAHLVVLVPPQPRARRSHVGRYEVDGELVRVDAPIWAEVPALAVPEPGGADPLAEEALAVIGDARDQREAVRRLVAHVASRLDGRPTPGSMAAIDALRDGRGDCDEASAAFVALARAVGLEAEPVGGLVYADGALGPGLYPHAWAEVSIGKRKVPVDPALGQAPADAGHLPLGAGAGQAAARLSGGVRVALVELR